MVVKRSGPEKPGDAAAGLAALGENPGEIVLDPGAADGGRKGNGDGSPGAKNPADPALAGTRAGEDAHDGHAMPDAPVPRAAVRSRSEEFLVSPNAKPALGVLWSGPGLAALSANDVAVASPAQFVSQIRQLNGPDFKVLGTIVPSGLTSLGTLAAPPPPAIAVIETTPEKAAALQDASAGQLVVSRNHPLVPADSLAPAFRDPAVLNSSGGRFAFSVQVAGEAGPLPNAEVYVFGSTTTAQGVTDQNGTASFALSTESASTIRGLLVQPASGYWNMLIRNPSLDPNGPNVVTVRPLSSTFPNLATSDTLGWGQRAIGLDRAPSRLSGEGIRVAIIDSGADSTHPDLTSVATGYDFPNQSDTTWRNDPIGHGTHCAGIICGAADNHTGIRGFAPGAEVHVLRILPEGRIDDLISAIKYCIDHNVDVANLSLGGVGDPGAADDMRLHVEPYIVKAKSMGVALIVAAGNSSGPVLYPASSPNVLAVSALGKTGEYPADSYHASLPLDPVQGDGFFFPRFSCFGPEVKVTAPGVAILSSVPGRSFVAWDGTSMAAPHVTGLAALVLAHNPDFQTTFRARNAARVDHLFQVLQNSCRKMALGDPMRTGAGLPDLERALQPTAGAQALGGGLAASPNASANGGQLTDGQIAELTRQITQALQASLLPGGQPRPN